MVMVWSTQKGSWVLPIGDMVGIVVEVWEEKKKQLRHIRRREGETRVIVLLLGGRGDCHMIWMEADLNPHLSIRVSTYKVVGRRAKRRPSDCCNADQSHKLSPFEEDWKKYPRIDWSVFTSDTYMN